MELILLENILNLGNIGDKVKVKNGYGRNFLLKRGKALRFNKENQELVNKKKDELNKKNNEIKNKFKEIAKLVNNKTFIIVLFNFYLKPFFCFFCKRETISINHLCDYFRLSRGFFM